MDAEAVADARAARLRASIELLRSDVRTEKVESVRLGEGDLGLLHEVFDGERQPMAAAEDLEDLLEVPSGDGFVE